MATDHEVEQFIQRQRVARLATVDGRARPHIVPIVFVYQAGRLYTPLDRKPKSAPPQRMRRVRNIIGNQHVQVLIDHYDEAWQRLAYVQLRGRAELIDAGEEYQRAVRLLERKYRQYGDLPLTGRPVIKVSVEQIVSWGSFTDGAA